MWRFLSFILGIEFEGGFTVSRANAEEGSIWILISLVFAAGAVGGIVNALLSHNGFLLPYYEVLDKKRKARVIRPGVIGNILIGGVAAIVSWGLYGPLSGAAVYGTSRNAQAQEISLTLISLAGAMLVGIAGARWLTNEVDKNLLHAALSRIAGQAAPKVKDEIKSASPSESLRIAKGL